VDFAETNGLMMSAFDGWIISGEHHKGKGIRKSDQLKQEEKIFFFEIFALTLLKMYR
jgi:hypothetical protein